MTVYELGIKVAQQNSVSGRLKQAYVKGFVEAVEKRAGLESKTIFRDHVADAEEADTTYPLYTTHDELVDGAHRLAKLLAQQKRTARTIDVTKALPSAIIAPDSSYTGQVYSDDKNSYAIALLREYVKQHNPSERRRATARLAQLNMHPWDEEIPLSEVVVALRHGKPNKRM